MQDYTALPSDPDIAAITADAQRITAGATNPYEQAKALRDYFRDPASGFVYDTSVDQVDSGSAIVAFLQDKHGFCVQFASAYAVMARSLGIPARVAVGFTPGTRGADGVFHVSSHDAHAWPEIWLAGLGWTHLFDPTPASSGVSTGGSQLANEPAVTTATATPPPTTAPPATVPGTSGATGGTPPGAGGTGTSTPASTPASGTGARPQVSTASPATSRWWLVLVALGLVVMLAGAYATLVTKAKARRRARRRAAPDPATAVTGAWDEALERLREVHVGARPGADADRGRALGSWPHDSDDGVTVANARALLHRGALRRRHARARRSRRCVGVRRRAGAGAHRGRELATALAAKAGPDDPPVTPPHRFGVRKSRPGVTI